MLGTWLPPWCLLVPHQVPSCAPQGPCASGGEEGVLAAYRYPTHHAKPWEGREEQDKDAGHRSFWKVAFRASRLPLGKSRELRPRQGWASQGHTAASVALSDPHQPNPDIVW